MSRAFALLNVCMKSGLITARFDVYCPDTKDFIGSYFPPQTLPESVECSYHDFETFHTRDEYLIRVMFEFARTVVNTNLKVAV